MGEPDDIERLAQLIGDVRDVLARQVDAWTSEVFASELMARGVTIDPAWCMVCGGRHDENLPHSRVPPG